MALEVVISERAEHNLADILEFLRKNWSEETRLNFLAQLSDKISQISRKPYVPGIQKEEGAPGSSDKQKTILYYRASSQRIEIVTIQSSRKDLDHLAF